MSIVFFGTTEYSAAMLKAILKADYHVSLAVTLRDRPSLRGHSLQPTPVKRLAEKMGIPVFCADNMKDPALAQIVRKQKAELGIVVAFKILPGAVYGAPKLGTVNVHPSLLPELRGPAPVRWAIMRGYSETGITTFSLVDKPDAGGILLQESISIGDDETYGELFERIVPPSADVLIRTIEGLLSGSLKPGPQDVSRVTNAPKITKELSRIDWSWPAREIRNLIRALAPKPGAVTESSDIGLKILRAEVVGGNDLPGTVISCDPKGGLIVACGENAISLTRLQTAGKRPMDAADFLRGCAINTGERFK